MNLAPEFWEFMVGEKIGQGASREVYSMKFDYETVLKVCDGGPNHFRQNIMEWETWTYVRNEDYNIKKWFAPCIAISPCGRLLLQRRTASLDPNKIPKELPSFLDDFKLDNFGMLDDRVVARDYGSLMGWAFSDKIRRKLTMKKVKWYA